MSCIYIMDTVLKELMNTVFQFQVLCKMRSQYLKLETGVR
jgi:hypothetical protein